MACADGCIYALSLRIPKETLKTLLTVNGKKFPDDMHAFLDSIVLDSPPAPRPRWDRITAVWVLALSYGLLIFGPIRGGKGLKEGE